MNGEAKGEGGPIIHIDNADVPASLLRRGKATPHATLREAISAWLALPDDLQRETSVKVDGEGGELYRPWEIHRIQYRRPKP